MAGCSGAHADEIIPDGSEILLVENEVAIAECVQGNRGETPIVGVDVKAAFAKEKDKPENIGLHRGLDRAVECENRFTRGVFRNESPRLLLVESLVDEIGMPFSPGLAKGQDVRLESLRPNIASDARE